MLLLGQIQPDSTAADLERVADLLLGFEVLDRAAPLSQFENRLLACDRQPVICGRSADELLSGIDPGNKELTRPDHLRNNKFCLLAGAMKIDWSCSIAKGSTARHSPGFRSGDTRARLRMARSGY